MIEVWGIIWETMKGLVGQWWFWVAYIVLVFGGWFGSWYLFSRREYRKINGRLCMKEGIGKWVDLEEHMKVKHPKEYASLKKQGKI